MALPAGTYTITSSGMIDTLPEGGPVYGSGSFSIRITAPVEVEPTPDPTTVATPAPTVTPAPVATPGPTVARTPSPTVIVSPAPVSLRVTDATPGMGSRSVSRWTWPRVTFSAQALFIPDLASTLADIATGRLVPIQGTYCLVTRTATIYPMAPLAAHHGYRISVTSASAHLKYRSTFRPGTR